MNCKKAQLKDFDSIKLLYDEIIDNTKDIEKYARWKKGQHPTDSIIKGYLDNQSMYLFKDNELIVGAMALTMNQGDDYHKIKWNINVQDNDVAVIHILGINPKYQRNGIGKQMIDEAIKIAKDNHKKVLRLDALASNTPAQKMYLGKGFTYCGMLNQYAENTGWTDFYFYEYIL